MVRAEMNPKPMLAGVPAPSTLVFVAIALSLAGCQKAPPEPTPDPDNNGHAATAHPGGDHGGSGDNSARPAQTPPKPAKRKISAKPVATVKPSDDDPLKGKWPLEDAVKGLPAGKEIDATIETDLGNIEC